MPEAVRLPLIYSNKVTLPLYLLVTKDLFILYVKAFLVWSSLANPKGYIWCKKPRIFASSLRREENSYETWGFSGNVGPNILSSSLGNARTTFRICNIVFKNANLEICYSPIFQISKMTNKGNDVLTKQSSK